MPGHGSTPPEDKAHHPNRQVGRPSGYVYAARTGKLGKGDKHIDQSFQEGRLQGENWLAHQVLSGKLGR